MPVLVVLDVLVPSLEILIVSWVAMHRLAETSLGKNNSRVRSTQQERRSFCWGRWKFFKNSFFSTPFNQQRSFFNFCTFLLQLQLCLLHTLYLLRNRHISVIHLAYSWHPRVLSPFATFSLLPGRIRLDLAFRHPCIGLFSDPARPMLAKQK